MKIFSEQDICKAGATPKRSKV